MTVLDFIIVGIIAISSLISVLRGFLKEAFSLAAWMLAGAAAFMLSPRLSVLVPDAVDSPTVRLGITAVTIFIITLFAGGMINFLIHKAAVKVGLSGTDRLLGVVFGVVRGVVIVVFLIVLAGLTPIPNEIWWQESVLIEHFVEVAGWLQSILPDDLARYLSFS
jgi:membrane protein required for colicin V production